MAENTATYSCWVSSLAGAGNTYGMNPPFVKCLRDKWPMRLRYLSLTRSTFPPSAVISETSLTNRYPNPSNWSFKHQPHQSSFTTTSATSKSPQYSPSSLHPLTTQKSSCECPILSKQAFETCRSDCIYRWEELHALELLTVWLYLLTASCATSVRTFEVRSHDVPSCI